METAARVAIIGLGACIVMDAWSFFLQQAFGIRMPDFAMVGRWLGHMAGGRFTHASIAASPPVRGERALGWVVHAITGIVYGGFVVALSGAAWLEQPTLLPALFIGIATLAVPFLVMQPSMGLGLAASKTPRPNAARLRSFAAHTVFGAGMYATAWLLTRLWP